MKKSLYFQSLLTILLLLTPLNLRADVYLVSVGISDYPGTAEDLRLPAQDARSMLLLYETNNKAHVSLLVDSQARKDDIIRQMREQFSKAGQNDIVVFFFSGHGAPGMFCVYDGNLSYNDIRSVFSSSKCENKMIFADACYSGKIRQDGRDEHDRKMNVMLFLSSRSNEVSIERSDMKNGLFTSCLVRCLKGGSDFDKDRTITAKELFNGVSDGVRKLSGDRQHPVMWGNFSDNMPVMRW